MPAKLKDLFWKDGYGRLTPWKIESHKEFMEGELARIAVSNEDLSKLIRSFYEKAAEEYYEKFPEEKPKETAKQVKVKSPLKESKLKK